MYSHVPDRNEFPLEAMPHLIDAAEVLMREGVDPVVVLAAFYELVEPWNERVKQEMWATVVGEHRSLEEAGFGWLSEVK